MSTLLQDAVAASALPSNIWRVPRSFLKLIFVQTRDGKSALKVNSRKNCKTSVKTRWGSQTSTRVTCYSGLARQKAASVMDKVKTFLKSNALWIGMVAVVVPLLAHIALQYRSLSELETTMPWARRALMRKQLQELTKEVTRTFQSKIERQLNVPASGFQDNRESEITSHFKEQAFKGAERLFIGTVSQRNDRTYASIFFYNPATGALEREPGSAQWRAAHAAAANWIAMIMTDTPALAPRLTVDERDPDNRIVVKPILNTAAHVVGVTGAIISEDYFRNVLLPDAIKATIESAYPQESDQVIITVTDSKENLVFSNQPPDRGEPEAGGAIPFIFTDWYLGIRMRNLSENQLARQYFIYNFSLSVVASLLLIGGAFLALRTASRAMKLSQMKADFVSNVSHELRTPLASIRVFGEFLKLGRVKDPEKTAEYGAYIETESRRLTQLIDNILDFSRIESGQKTYRFEYADLSQLVAETLRVFVVRLEQSGFEITFDAPPRRTAEALIDSEAISQAFINILDNAVKYSGDAKRIKVSVDSEPGWATVSITDEGIGMENEELEKIFEKFYRVSTGLVHDVKGSGLGLSIVKHVIEAHHGRVTVQSKPGQGTTFTLYLPAREEEASSRESVTGEVLNPSVELKA
jgi:signal transduction histidine kinase